MMPTILLIQFSLLVVIVWLIVKVLASRGTHAGNAWHKIGLLLLAVVMIAAVLLPDTVTSLAHAVGVGRGTDLVTYILFATFIYYVIHQYLKAQELRDTTYRLARKVALIDARSRYPVK